MRASILSVAAAFLCASGALAGPAAIPVDQGPKLFPLIGGLYGPPVLELHEPRNVRIDPGLMKKLWSSKTQPLPPGTGSSVITKVVEGPVLQELLAAVGLRGDQDLFIKSFKPDAGDRVWRFPLKDVGQLLVRLGAGQEPPEDAAQALVANIHLDVSKVVPALQSGWVGVAWLAASNPFGDQPMRNLVWRLEKPLFPNREVNWKRTHPVPASGPEVYSIEPMVGPLGDHDLVNWGAGAIGEGLWIVRATSADGHLVGLYLRSGEQVWVIYDFTKAPPPIDPDHPRPDPEPAALALKGAYKVLLQIGDIGSPFSHLVLIDSAGQPSDLPLRWGRPQGTGE